MFNRIVLFGSVVLFASARRNAEHSLRQQGARLEQALARRAERARDAEAGQPDEGRLPRDGLARAAHAAQRHPRMGGDAQPARRRRADRRARPSRPSSATRQAQARIVDDILDFSSIAKGRLKLRAEPVALAAIVREAIETVRLSAAAKAITIEPSLDVDAIVPGDPDRLRQIRGTCSRTRSSSRPAEGASTCA